MFENLNLSAQVIRALNSKGFTTATEIQQKCIPLIMQGKDVVGRSQTGSGKTLAFGLPAIEMIDTQIEGIEILVVCPTRELALQVTDEIRWISKYIEGCRVVPIYGGADIEKQIKLLKGAKIVVGTPGRIMDHIGRRTLKLFKLKMVVLDEADEMLNMGFRPDIEKILSFVHAKRQTVMFSATMPLPIMAIAQQYMNQPEYVEVGQDNATVKEIEQSYIKVKRNGKKAALLEIFKTLNPERAIIFCNTKRMVDEIVIFLRDKGLQANALHGDIRQSERKRVMQSIKARDSFILAATDVAARGIDISDIDYVINFDLPKDLEYYIHRIGRTARAGKTGKALSIINDLSQLKSINEYAKLSKSIINENSISKDLSVYDDFETKGGISTSYQPALLQRKQINKSEKDERKKRDYRFGQGEKRHDKVGKGNAGKRKSSSKANIQSKQKGSRSGKEGSISLY